MCVYLYPGQMRFRPPKSYNGPNSLFSPVVCVCVCCVYRYRFFSLDLFSFISFRWFYCAVLVGWAAASSTPLKVKILFEHTSQLNKRPPPTTEDVAHTHTALEREEKERTCLLIPWAHRFLLYGEKIVFNCFDPVPLSSSSEIWRRIGHATWARDRPYSLVSSRDTRRKGAKKKPSLAKKSKHLVFPLLHSDSLNIVIYDRPPLYYVQV